MIRRKKFDLAVADLRRWIESPSTTGGAFGPYWAGDHFWRFKQELATGSGKLRELTEAVRRIRETTAEGRTLAEEQLLSFLKRVGLECQRLWKKDGFSAKAPTDPEGALRRVALLDCAGVLCGFAMESLQYRRPRDSFAGMRRGGAWRILAALSPAFDTSEFVPLARKALHANWPEATGAAEFFGGFYMKPARSAPEDLIAEMHEVAETTPSRRMEAAIYDALERIHVGAGDEEDGGDDEYDWL